MSTDIRMASRIANYQKMRSYLEPLYSESRDTKSVRQDRDSLVLTKNLFKKQSGMISEEFLDIINFDFTSVRQYPDQGIFVIGRTIFSSGQIPDVSPDRFNEVKAVNNVLTFKSGEYYKFTDSYGKVYKMACVTNSMAPVYSDSLKGKVDSESGRCGWFWDIMAENATFIGLYFSDEEQKEYLNAAGITEGFFTDIVGNTAQEYFYSNGNPGIAVLKGIYDTQYNAIKNEGRIFDYCEPGTVIKVDGEEYVLNEDHTLDIPYGADIFKIEYPPSNYTI